MPSCILGFKQLWENFTHEETVQQSILNVPMSQSQEGDVSKSPGTFHNSAPVWSLRFLGLAPFCGAFKVKSLGVGLK